MNIFPELKNKRWLEVNLDLESRESTLDLSDPTVCSAWIKKLHRKKEADYTYGGFLEDRSNLWRNHYNKESDSFTHLGIDFNVPAGTKVALPRKARVEHIMLDKDGNGGWGGRVIWKMLDHESYLLYGHLQHDLDLKVGEVKEKGYVFSQVADNRENGGWWPHLHLQVMHQNFINHFDGNWEKIDGYLPRSSKLLHRISSPMYLIEF